MRKSKNIKGVELTQKKTLSEVVSEMVEKIEAGKKILHLKFEDVNPATNARARVSRAGFVYDPKQNKDFKKFLKDTLIAQLPDGFTPIDSRVSMVINAFKPMPKYIKTDEEKYLYEIGVLRPETKPDVDNHAKIVLDAFNKILYTDDAKVVSLTVNKFLSEKPRLEVIVTYYIY